MFNFDSVMAKRPAQRDSTPMKKKKLEGGSIKVIAEEPKSKEVVTEMFSEQKVRWNYKLIHNMDVTFESAHSWEDLFDLDKFPFYNKGKNEVWRSDLSSTQIAQGDFFEFGTKQRYFASLRDSVKGKQRIVELLALRCLDAVDAGATDGIIIDAPDVQFGDVQMKLPSEFISVKNDEIFVVECRGVENDCLGQQARAETFAKILARIQLNDKEKIAKTQELWLVRFVRNYMTVMHCSLSRNNWMQSIKGRFQGR